MTDKKTLLDETLHTDAQAIHKRLAKLHIDEDDKLVVHKDELVDLLALSRQLARDAEADYKEATANLSEQMKPYSAEYKSLTKSAKESADALADAVMRMVKHGDITEEGVESANGTQLALVKKHDLVVDDYAKLDAKYLLPIEQRYDLKAIQADAEKVEKALEFAVKNQVDVHVDPVEGVHLETTYTLRTKLVDTVE